VSDSSLVVLKLRHVVVAALPKSIVSKDGRELKTLADARALILALPESHRADSHWDHAAELLTAAAQGKPAFVNQFSIQLKRALKAEGLI
jgi:hypothetical protein